MADAMTWRERPTQTSVCQLRKKRAGERSPRFCWTATNTPDANLFLPPIGGPDRGLFKSEPSGSGMSLGTPETDVVVPVAGMVVVAVRRTHVLRVVVPAAATHHPVVALRPLTDPSLSDFETLVHRWMPPEFLPPPRCCISMHRYAEGCGISGLQLQSVDETGDEPGLPPVTPRPIKLSPTSR